MLSSIFSSEHAKPLGVLACMLAVTLLAIFGASEWLLRTQVAPQDNRPGHLALLAEKGPTDAAFGDSHAARGFDARDGFVNLAYPSENIKDMLIKAQGFYADRPAGRVILQADPHLFARYRVQSPASDLTADTPMLMVASARHRPQLRAYWRSFVKNGGELVSTVQQTPAGALLSSGDLALDSPRRQTFDARIRLLEHRVASPQMIAQEQARYAALLGFLQDRGADICLVTYPVSQAYADARDDRGWRAVPSGHDRAMAFFEDQASQRGLRHWDARQAVTDTADFRDIDHLNVQGAQSFADRLINHCFSR